MLLEESPRGFGIRKLESLSDGLRVFRVLFAAFLKPSIENLRYSLRRGGARFVRKRFWASFSSTASTNKHEVVAQASGLFVAIFFDTQVGQIMA